MKKSTIIFTAVLSTISLSAFGYWNWKSNPEVITKNTCMSASAEESFMDDMKNFAYPMNNVFNSDFYYQIDSRFIHTITKEELKQAKSILDILPENATESVVSYQLVKVALLKDQEEISEMGTNEKLNDDQLALLQSTDYSSNFYIYADYSEKNARTGKLEPQYLSYYISVVPEVEAIYPGGKDALIKFIRSESEEKTAFIDKQSLKPGKLSFTILKDGSVSDIQLISTSGHEYLDKELVTIVKSLPKNWIPAKNQQGEAMEQQLFLSFGIPGC